MVLVIWRFDPDVNNGLPSSEVLDSMEEFENRILEVADEQRWWGTGVAVVTTDGTREWRFYTPDAGTFVTEFSNALAGYGPYPLELTQCQDEDWTALVELQEGCIRP